MKFKTITLTRISNKEDIDINLNHIICFYSYGENTKIEFSNGDRHTVLETLSKVRAIINEIR
jgi:hypothetical protein